MGYHHFHLGENIEPQGFATRTNDLLFAKVTREQFDVIAIFDHSVFDLERSANDEMRPERQRLWEVFHEHSSQGMPPGSAYIIPSMITTSGHSIHLVRLADEYSRIVRELDPKLDEKVFLAELYASAKQTVPKNPNLSWHLHVLDLGLLEGNTNTFFVFHYGQN